MSRAAVPLVAAPFVILSLALARPAPATVVVRPTLDELTAEAAAIFVGEVVEVSVRRLEIRDGPTVVTDVTYRVERTLKGDARTLIRLEFLGGALGEERVWIPGMPRFRPGDRDVLFVSPGGSRLSPLVGFAEGRFRLSRDPRTGEELVSYHDFRPVLDVAAIGTAAERPRAGRALPLASFEREVRDRVARQAGRGAR
jgi:hypothetical protein